MQRLKKESQIMKEYKENGISFEMIEPLKKWNVYLKDFDKDTKLYSELKKYNIKQVKMEITIKKNYPFMPPFVRIVEPRFSGYKGFITTGGSLCVDVLTINGWVPTYTLISLMNQLKIFINAGEIDIVKYNIPYTLKEAEHHYNHTTKFHKWDKAV